jgi:formylglycine-generating enzyme required for sulfatase activity
MHGSVRVGYDYGKTQPDKEYNVEAFIKEAQKVFTADWDITITPLDTCGTIVLRDDKYKKVLNSASFLTKVLMENYRVWSGNNFELTNARSSVLFDTVAIYLAMGTDLVEMESLGIRVTDDGYTVIDEKAKKINCAMKWKNLDAFENLLIERITNPIVPDTKTAQTVTQAIADDGGPIQMVWVTINDSEFVGQMSKYETTNAQYCQFLNAAIASGDIIVEGTIVKGAKGSNSGADFVGQVYYNLAGAGYNYDGANNGGAARIIYSGGKFTVDGDFGKHPVTYVSWYGATAFASYYGWRLPTEWEWQAVADYDRSYIYGCGKAISNSKANFRTSTHPHGTTAVGSFESYGYGMSDMAGNVWEWTSTTDGNFSVHRGGSWYGFDLYCEVSSRFNSYPYESNCFSGFRVCH